MSQVKEKREQVVDEFQQHSGDTGSAEVQIALLTERIGRLTGHMQKHPNDYAARRGLIDLVEKRKKNLRHLRKNYPERYREITEELDL